jgi:dTMP kinase
MNGVFITIEGPDGSGKTSVTDEVSKKLKSLGIDFIRTREPGGIDIAEQIRDIILNPKNTKMDAKTEALLYAASRRQHLVEKVIPALEAGQVVLCERFVDSSLAYQGVGREIGIEAVYTMNQFAIDGVMPDLTIFLDIDPEVGIKRINENRKNKDRLDMEKIEFHERVYQGYQAVKALFKDRIIIVDGNKPLDDVVNHCFEIILKRIKG